MGWGLQGLALNSRIPRGQVLAALVLDFKWSGLGLEDAVLEHIPDTCFSGDY